MEITELFTEPEWRSKKIGRRLMERAIRYARDHGLNPIRLQADAQSREPNAQTILVQFYNSLGFSLDGQGRGNWMTLNL